MLKAHDHRKTGDAVLLSVIGTFETCRGGLMMSVVRGNSEVAVRDRQDRF